MTNVFFLEISNVTPSCSRVLQAVRSVRDRLRTGSSQEYDEQRTNFAPYSRRIGSSNAKKAKSSWRGKFFCLSDKDAVNVPCGAALRESLIEAGLGPKTIFIDDTSCSLEEFKATIVASYPKLDGCGGFELLRCIPNSKSLTVISPAIAHSPKHLRNMIGGGKVYIRPIQKDLSLDVDKDCDLPSDPVCIMFSSLVYPCPEIRGHEAFRAII